MLNKNYSFSIINLVIEMDYFSRYLMDASTSYSMEVSILIIIGILLILAIIILTIIKKMNDK